MRLGGSALDSQRPLSFEKRKFDQGDWPQNSSGRVLALKNGARGENEQNPSRSQPDGHSESLTLAKSGQIRRGSVILANFLVHSAESEADIMTCVCTHKEL